MLLIIFVITASASVSLHAQEFDYRFVDPAGHMQPWPDVEPEVHLTPTETTFDPPQRIAIKWQTKIPELSGSNAATPQDSTPQPERKDLNLSNSSDESQSGVDSVKDQVEQLDTPPPSETDADLAEQQSSDASKNCYQAPPLSAMSVNIALPEGVLPVDAAAMCALQHGPVTDKRLVGAWGGTDFHWSATCMRHRPLYFEEINAERYGYTLSYTFQPVISAARFFATIPALPYKMVVECPRDCIYTLGHYRPGSCAPRRWHRLPCQLTAGVVETGFIAGMILLIP